MATQTKQGRTMDQHDIKVQNAFTNKYLSQLYINILMNIIEK